MHKLEKAERHNIHEAVQVIIGFQHGKDSDCSFLVISMPLPLEYVSKVSQVVTAVSREELLKQLKVDPEFMMMQPGRKVWSGCG